MNKSKVASSTITSVGYDAPTQTLEVEFLNGYVYQYYGVPDNIHKALMQASSKGKFLYLYIKNGYPYSRVA